MGHMFHADPKDLAALVTAYADAGPDPVGDHARRGALFFSDHLEDLACLVADGAGNLAADFRPAVLAELSIIVGWAKDHVEGANWPRGAGDAILSAIDASARRHGLARPADKTSWVADPALSWSGRQEDPYDALLAFGVFAARSHDIESVSLSMDGHCTVDYTSDETTEDGVEMRVTVPERPDMGAATVREGWKRNGVAAVRFVSDSDGCRFELNVASLEGFVLLDAVAGGVFPFPEELQSARLAIEETWFHNNALPTLRDFLAEAAEAGDADAGRVCALLESDPGAHWKVTRRAWALAVRLAGLRPDPRTGSVAGWAAKGPEIARHFTDELVMATVLEPLREPRRAA